MKKTAYATLAALLLSATAASAQDARWSGLHLGAHVGHAWGDLSATHCPDDICGYPGLLSHGGAMSASGWLGGVQVGANYQMGGIVVGIEADVSKIDLSSSQAFRMDFDTDWATRMSLDVFGTARAKIGFVTGPALIYATGGLAWGHGEMQIDTISITGPVTMSQLSEKAYHLGWTAGAGAEWALGPNLSVKGEWLYVDLGNVSYDPKGLAYAGTPGEFDHHELSQGSLDFHTFRVGLNYRFGQ